MANWKSILKSAISRTLPTAAWMRMSGQNLFMPFYHTIADHDLQHIKHLYKVRSSKLFEQDLDVLLKHFEPIDLFQLIDAIQNGKKLPKRAFFLSFDDGLKECATIIAPILERKGIPATFFINSEYLEQPKALMFRYKASLLMDFLAKKSSDNYQHILQKHLQQSQGNTLSQVRHDEDHLLNTIAEAFHFSFDDYIAKYPVYMDHREIRTLIKKGFTIGSHSVNHPHYFRISADDQILQTVAAQMYLDQEFGLDYKVFAFPFTDFDVSKHVIQQLLEQHAFDLIFGGAGLKHDTFNQHLQRFPIETEKATKMQDLIRGEYAYYCLKSFLGKNKIHRQ